MPAQTCARLQLVQEVDIAVLTGFLASHGPEDLQPSDAIPLTNAAQFLLIDGHTRHIHTRIVGTHSWCIGVIRPEAVTGPMQR